MMLSKIWPPGKSRQEYRTQIPHYDPIAANGTWSAFVIYKLKRQISRHLFHQVHRYACCWLVFLSYLFYTHFLCFILGVMAWLEFSVSRRSE